MGSHTRVTQAALLQERMQGVQETQEKTSMQWTKHANKTCAHLGTAINGSCQVVHHPLQALLQGALVEERHGLHKSEGWEETNVQCVSSICRDEAVPISIGTMDATYHTGRKEQLTHAPAEIPGLLACA